MTKTKSKMTLDELALMTQGGFLSIEKQMKEFVTKKDLRETEEHLLDAIRGIEVKKHDLESLQANVDELSRRVSAVEKS